MKKQLLAGTAIVAASVLIAGGAVAADKKMMKPSISVNGYYEGVVGGILDEDMGADTSALDTRTDAEIHFNGRGSLDNGMKLHARVELEGQNNHRRRQCWRRPDRRVFHQGLGVVRQHHARRHRRCAGQNADRNKRFLGDRSVGENLSFDDAWVTGVRGGGGHGFYTMQPLATGHRRRGESHRTFPRNSVVSRIGGDLLAEPCRTTMTASARNDTTEQRHDGSSRVRSAMVASSATSASPSAPA